MKKHNLFGKSLSELETFVLELGEKKFRATQLFEWLYKERVSSFQEMLNLSIPLREKLEQNACIERLNIVSKQTSLLDNTVKFLFQLFDEKKIESVVIPPRTTAVDVDTRLTLCVSTQVGCPLDCKFCATASMGFLRNLTASEILNQVILAQQQSTRPITNIVFMGMGEPMLNYDNVMNAIDILTSPTGFAMSPRRITVSTAGYVQQIRKMADEGRKVKLALSLHSLDSATRLQIMPITKKYNVDELLDALEYYHHITKKGVMLEYILFDGVNDSDSDVAKLIKVSRRFECKVNLIPYHSIQFTNPQGFAATLRGVSEEKMLSFARKLRDGNVDVFIRNSSGVDIDAACGQLAINSAA